MSVAPHETKPANERAASARFPDSFTEATASDVMEFLANRPDHAIVSVSISGCSPCRWMHPVLHKLAAEFSVPTFLLDGDAERDFVRHNQIEAYPTLFFYRDGELARTLEGYENYADLRAIVVGFLGRSTDGATSDAEREFAAAIERARIAVDVAMEPASLAIEPHIEIVTPLLQSHWERLKRQVEEGGLTLKEARRRQRVERERLYAPFQDKIDALRQAQEAAMLAYEARAEKIVRAFGIASIERVKDVAAASVTCDGNSCRLVRVDARQ